jgi:hypothetical protein
MAEIGGDESSRKWTSSRLASRAAVKAPWLADAIAKFDKNKKKAGSVTVQQAAEIRQPVTATSKNLKKKTKP